MPALGIIQDTADDVGATYNLNSRQLRFDMEDTIHQLEPSGEPYMRMMTHADFNTKPAKAQKVEWLEDQLMPRSAAAALGATTGSNATGFVAAVATGYGAYFRINDVVRNEATGELSLVTAVSGDNITLGYRGIGAGGTGTLFATTSDVLVIVSNASFEGANMSAIRMTRKSNAFNNTQIFRHSYGFTETLLATGMYGPQEPAAEAQKKMIEHRRALEHTFFVGQKDLRNPANQHPQSFAGGVMSFITAGAGSKVTSGAITVAGLEAFLLAVFRYGSRQKVAFASPIFLQALSAYSAAKMALSTWGEGTVYGVSTTRYKTSLNDSLLVVPKRDWGDFPNASPGMGGTMVVLDMANVTYRPLRKTFVKTNIQANDADQRIDEVTTESTIQVVLPQTHGLWQGATGFS
jgi:hypothetical protein